MRANRARLAAGALRRWAWSVALATPVLFPVGASSYELTRVVFSGGAVSTSGPSHTLRGTVGESGVVGLVADASHVLHGGFWGGIWRLVATDATPDVASEIRFENSLRSSTPNPFRSSTVIEYSVAHRSPVTLTLYDVTGRRTARLVDAVHEPGRYRTRWDGVDVSGHPVASGVYFYRIEIGSWSATRKVLKLR